MRVAVLGGNGFIGRHLASALRARGDEPMPLSLRDPIAAARSAVRCDAIVNLAGETLAQRWSAQVKQRIMESRTALPSAFLDELGKNERNPAVYVSASAIGYYGTSENETFTEDSPAGTDFLAHVCIEWERNAQRAASLGMRLAFVRCGLVLGTDGGALPKLLPLFKAGTGGRVGSGKQWYSWIHVTDAVGIYLRAIDALSGAINATAPAPVTNQEFTETLAGVLHRPAALPVPAFMVNLALGEGAMLVLEGQRVVPQRALDMGYSFQFPVLQDALGDLLAE